MPLQLLVLLTIWQGSQGPCFLTVSLVMAYPNIWFLAGKLQDLSVVGLLAEDSVGGKAQPPLPPGRTGATGHSRYVEL